MLGVGVSLRHLRGTTAVDAYKVAGFSPQLVLDYENSKFRVSGSTSTAPSVVTATRTGLATQLDASGNLVWNAHNLWANSETYSAWGVGFVSGATVSENSVTITSTDGYGYVTSGVVISRLEGASYTLEVDVTSDTTVSNVGIRVDNIGGSPFELVDFEQGVKQRISLTWTASSSGSNNPGIGVEMRDFIGAGEASGFTITFEKVSVYRSDLGGMAPVPLTRRVAGSTTYVPTTSAAVYLPREEAYTYVSGSLVGPYYQKESDARTNLLHTTNALVTQTVTVTAVPHTLHFTGTGTVTLLGVSAAGPLVGTGTGENNRVSLTFTPTAGILTLTVSGTVSDAQLEVGSTLSSYIPNLAASGTVTRSADSTTISAGNMPYPTPQVIGPELVTNGTFDTDTDWIKGTGITITGGEAVFTAVATGQNLRQPITLPAGVYLISYDVTEYTTGGVAVFGPAYSPDIQRTAAGSYSEVAYFPGNGNLDIRARGTTTLKVDNISVREINPLALSFQMDGLMTYADEGSANSVLFSRWSIDGNNQITTRLSTASSDTGKVQFILLNSASFDIINSATDAYSPGINVPFNIASRHGSTFINGAVDGTALTANLTPTALPDLSATTFELAPTFNGFIKEFRVWADDIGDTGIAEAST